MRRLTVIQLDLVKCFTVDTVQNFMIIDWEMDSFDVQSFIVIGSNDIYKTSPTYRQGPKYV